MKKSQQQIVLERIEKTGKVSRNWCLQRNITRLSAIIQDLEEAGYNFETGYGKKLGMAKKDWKDYFYYFLNKLL